ncbi:MAG: hypothetical protein ACM3W4_01925, partial [Ignavibacteriales bacterium]
AALEGFRLTRETPRIVLVWVLVYMVVKAIINVMLVAFAGRELNAWEAAAEAGAQDPALTMAFLEKAWPVTLLGMTLTIVFAAAVYRLVLRPADSKGAYLRLGMDEMRLALILLIFVGLAAVFAFAIVLAFGIMAGIAAVAAHMTGDKLPVTLVALLGALAGVAVLPTFVWLWIRLSLAWPMSFAERRIRIFESWRLTHHQFWRLFGTYLLALILTIIVAVLGLIIYVAVAAMLTGWSAAVQVFQPDATSLATYFTPAMVIYTVFGGALGALQYLIIIAPGALAYQELAESANA